MGIQTLNREKFQNPEITAKGEKRAIVALTHLRTLWFNTGSLCNITCQNCYMDSSPTNDRLAYLSATEVSNYLDEAEHEGYGIEEIAFTGGEPFMNPELVAMLSDALERGYKVLVLTNAMKPLHHKKSDLLALNQKYEKKLTLRVSIDHFSVDKHEKIRGPKTWDPMISGLRWLAENEFNFAVAGRTLWEETEEQSRLGYQELFKQVGIKIDLSDPSKLVLFPEMDASLDVPEITVSCWEILGVAPETMMCATSRMIVKRKGDDHPLVTPCTLLPYDQDFELGSTLSQSATNVSLNHPHCARFCVLGGASCSPG